MEAIKRFVPAFRDELHRRLQEKTSWGRNDLTLVIEQCISHALQALITD